MQFEENTVVANRFRLGKMIGRGGMGSVWAATQIGLERPCALKFIEGEMAKLAEAHQRFEREAKAAAHLNSPNIVQIYDHGVWEGTPYIAMELLDGEDLGHRIAARGGKMDAGELYPMIAQVCRALSRAHQAGIVHRDLKPDNLFIVRDDDREIVKILDFGVAKSAQALEGSNTRTGAMLGTPYYMSPEQAQGIKSVDARSDLWSLAVIVYQCLTGHLPFESEALGDLLVKIIVQPVPVPSKVMPTVPPGFDRWWARAAERNPDLRFQTAKELAESLALALGHSQPGDLSDAGRRIGGSTAVMQNGPVAASPPLGSKPPPAYGPAAYGLTPPGSVMPNASTGSPVATPYSDSAALVPKRGPSTGLIVGAVGAVVLLGAIAGVAVVSRGRAEQTNAGAAPSATSPVVAAPASATPAPAEVVSAAAPTTAAPAPSAQQPVVAPAKVEPARDPAPAHTTPKPTASHTAQPATSKPAASGKGRPVDFGF